MNFWQALGTVVKESTFYKKQFFLFVAIFVIGIGVFYFSRGQQYKAVVDPNATSSETADT